MNDILRDVIIPAIAAIVIGLAGFFGTRLEIAWKRIADDKTKKSVAETCVKSVEQLYKELHGDEKKQKAIESIAKMLDNKGIPVTELELEQLVEEAVAEFNAKRKTD